MSNEIKRKAQELYPISENAECYTAFLQGASELIDKACDWIANNIHKPKYITCTWGQARDLFINDFKKAMEE